MNEKIQHILNLVQQSCKLSEEEKEAIIKSLKDADKEISISAFKIERLEKVKYTTTVLLEQTIEELETKRKSVEEQKRELEIEAALERVRARTMAMQKSDELPQAANLLFQQVQSLGMPAFAAGYCIWEDDKQAITLWMSSEGILQPPFKAPTTKDELFIQMRKGYEEGKTLHVVEMGGEELVAHYQYMRTLPVVGDIFDSLLKAGHSLPAFQVMHQAYFSKGFLLFITYEPVPESHEIFKRFALVFDQTYTRFLDLQKAEAQSRESQIQLALERVRARTMAMQKSEELPETSYILFQQFKELGEPAEQLSIGVVHEENNVIEISATLYGDMLKKIYWHSIDEPYMMSKIYSAWKTQQKTLVVELKGDDLNAYNKYRNELTKSEIFPTNLGNEHRRIVYAAFFSKGMLALAANEPRPQESLELLQRFAAVFDLTYTRFIDLKKAEAQTRESQIQLALERVRARTMAMQHSDELSETAHILFQQFKHLGEDPIQITIGIFNEEQNVIEFRITGGDGSGSRIDQTFHADIDEPTLINKFFRAWKENKKSTIISLEGKELSQWIAYRNKISGEYAHETEVKSTDHRYAAAGFFSKGLLSVSTIKPPAAETIQILERFASVFDLTYTRFIDLKKAEAQARESHIQLALERVRARTMAMHKSEELAETAQVMFQQLQELGGIPDRISIGIADEKAGLVNFWATDQAGSHINNNFTARLSERTVIFKTYQAWKANKRSLVIDLRGSELQEWIRFAREEMGIIVKDKNIHDRRVHNLAFFSHGWILVTTHEPQSVETIEILERFASVFSLTYRRFLDLQKAEEQARDAQIEASLERVRASAMAMHNSNDISSTTNIVFAELKKLNIQSKRCGVVLLSKESRIADVYAAATSSDGQSHTLRRSIEMTQHPSQVKQYESWLSQKNYISVLSGEELKSYYQLPFFYSSASYTPPENYDHKEYGYYIPFSEGLFYAWTESPYSDTEVGILNRFKSIIDLTFRRYLDLQKAELQAREAQIETALEKVRSRTLAMQKSDELAETAAVLFQQLIKLGIEPNRLYIGIINDESGDLEFWITDEDGNKVSKRYVVSIHNNISIKKMYEGWREKRKTLTIDMQGKELMQWLVYWNQEFGVPFKEGAGKQRRVQNISYFASGFIAIASWNDQPEETLSLLDRFAAVFNLTYTRFNDLKVAEAHALQAEEDLKKLIAEKKRTEDALTELKATQQQLVHAEKMASLGELTAGIAHEIQNPLNFINNFSEVNKELLDEMKEEMLTGNIEEAKTIADDIKDNELKIMHHGKRADAIVKSMLQHSRKTSGQKEETNINTLVDEYLRLSYHGLRAKDKTFNAVLETHFDPAIGKVKIVGQDIGRVLLNLFNNAFYAVNEKKKVIDENYEPMVQVTTTKINGRVEIKVKDNGTGIPEKVLDKIYQPFFTTKPTGEGTGLGLSLSYDIITKGHGGEMKVQTKEGEGSEFVIQLPFD